MESEKERNERWRGRDSERTGEKDVTQAWVKRREMRDEGTGETVGKIEKRV